MIAPRSDAAVQGKPGSAMKKLVKFLHEVGAVGVMGALAALIVLAATATAPPLADAGASAPAAPVAVPAGLAAYAAVRHGMAEISRWLLVPSLALVTISGLLAIAINGAYTNAGWAWLKALTGVSMFEGTLLTVAGSARQADELMQMALTGQADPAALAEILRTEWGGLWVIMGVCVANIVLAVWRPRIGPRPLRDADAAADGPGTGAETIAAAAPAAAPIAAQTAAQSVAHAGTQDAAPPAMQAAAAPATPSGASGGDASACA